MSKKQRAWLSETKEPGRGSNFKPMKEETVARRWRKIIAKESRKVAAPRENGTVSYSAPSGAQQQPDRRVRD